MIFETFMKGILSFVIRYNTKNYNVPIKQINVGFGNNKLKKQVEIFEKASQNLFIPKEYNFYDAEYDVQYILYTKDKENILIEKYLGEIIKRKDDFER